MASDEIERSANRTRMAASLIEPIISMKKSSLDEKASSGGVRVDEVFRVR
jgi:hypothetical protein